MARRRKILDTDEWAGKLLRRASDGGVLRGVRRCEFRFWCGA